MFGPDPNLWKFRCPCCGNIQTAKEFMDLGADPNHVYQGCIGRELQRDQRASHFGSKPARATGKTMPCDYAAFGLFALGGVRYVLSEGGTQIAVFPFAEVA